MRFIAIWSAVTIGACCVLQFREVSYLPFFFQFLLVIWWMLPPILTIDAAIVATRGNSWSAGLRSLAESVGLVVATFAAMAALRATFGNLGVG